MNPDAKIRMAASETLTSVAETASLCCWPPFFYLGRVVVGKEGVETLSVFDALNNCVVQAATELFADFVVVRFGPQKPFDEALPWLMPRTKVLLPIYYAAFTWNFIQPVVIDLIYVIGPGGECFTYPGSSRHNDQAQVPRYTKEQACLDEIDGR